MEIDGGPPPFCATVDDDDDAHPFEKNPFDDVDDDDESSPDSSSLPLPVTPVMDIKREEEKEGESQERGDTNASEPQNEQNIEEDDDEWGDFGEAVAAPAPIQNVRKSFFIT
uniref:SIT4 phosphatase-associated family protein n=1 Tax=Caenorhabditis tropicalis TaxID=1561998 RepID=A0A1I7TXK9_9PELO